MKILLVNGSVSEKSHTKALLNYIRVLLEERGHQVAFWDLKQSPLPIVLPEYHKDPMRHPDSVVKKFVYFTPELGPLAKID